jgi:hypothetical protein
VKYGGGVAERSDTAYVTPIEAIFDDIKEVTGALEVVLLGTELGDPNPKILLTLPWSTTIA